VAKDTHSPVFALTAPLAESTLQGHINSKTGGGLSQVRDSFISGALGTAAAAEEMVGASVVNRIVQAVEGLFRRDGTRNVAPMIRMID